ncbi:hypothetical protein BVG13_16540 [Acinetobacter baumannii]|nr:hypothetical protein BVG13_16540 [Acinetobacter baumannii]
MKVVAVAVPVMKKKKKWLFNWKRKKTIAAIKEAVKLQLKLAIHLVNQRAYWVILLRTSLINF